MTCQTHIDRREFFYIPLHLSSSAIPLKALSMWFPQPAQVHFPQLHLFFLHIFTDTNKEEEGDGGRRLRLCRYLYLYRCACNRTAACMTESVAVGGYLASTVVDLWTAIMFGLATIFSCWHEVVLLFETGSWFFFCKKQGIIPCFWLIKIIHHLDHMPISIGFNYWGCRWTRSDDTSRK